MTTLNEIWKPIKGYEDIYHISNFGRVKNIHKNRIWNGHKARNGYMKIYLCRHNSGKSRFVHDIVAETFLVKPEGCTEVDHIDRDPSNNLVTNLRWVTHTDNVRNCRTNRMITIDGVTKGLAEWSEESNISYHTIKRRLLRNWSEKDAVFKATSTKRTLNMEYNRKPNYNSTLYEFEGEKHTIPEWARIKGLNKNTLLSRKNMGWSIEEILTKPIAHKKKTEGDFE